MRDSGKWSKPSRSSGDWDSLTNRQIICIQEEKELAKYIYFPEKPGEVCEFGQYTIECLSVNIERFITRRSFKFSYQSGSYDDLVNNSIEKEEDHF